MPFIWWYQKNVLRQHAFLSHVTGTTIKEIGLLAYPPKDGCILHLINRNNNSDREVFIITLLFSFILIHRHVCHSVLSSIKVSYEQFHRHAET
jgi:hypothetical protein